MSSTIYVIRHGDKPAAKGQKPLGVKDSGEEDVHSLIVRGWQRSGFWVAYFFPPSGAPFAGITPENLYVFASARGGAEADDASSDSTDEVDGSKSRRPVETATALAARLRSRKHPDTPRTPDQDFTKGQEAQVAQAAIARHEDNVVICWQHENIRLIVNAVMGRETIPDAVRWPYDCYNGIIVLKRTAAGDWHFSQIAPVMLDGDVPALPFGEL